MRQSTVASRRSYAGSENPHWRGGVYAHPLYHIYHEMKARCVNPNHKRYVDYGERGVVICDRWLESFANFLEDMGERPGGYIGKRPEYSLDRVDNDGPYSPENCKWSTYKEQNNNKRSNRVLV